MNRHVNHRSHRPLYLSHRDRLGFTLIELMVAVGIILVLTGFTIYSVNVAFTSDRVSGSARQVQSYLEGARDRAIFSKDLRGVRFIFNEDDPTVVHSMIYIKKTKPVTGTLTINVGASGPDAGLIVTNTSTTVSWQTLYDRGLLRVGNRIRIGNVTPPPNPPATQPLDAWYTIESTSDVSNEKLKLTSEHVDLPIPFNNTDELVYDLKLTPTTLEETEPTQLVKGIVIDLDQSKYPGSWKSGSNFTKSMDVMFSPRGGVVGPAAGKGIVHLVISDYQDVIEGLLPGDAGKKSPDLIVTLFTRTGHISTHQVYNENSEAEASGSGVQQHDLNGNGIFDKAGSDPFYYAEAGEVSQ